jgi:hypothetical protein
VKRIVLALIAISLLATAPAFAQGRTYKVLATNKTSTMEKELQEAGAIGYRFVSVMGGETATAGNEVVVLMEKDPDNKLTYEYRLLATTKTSTLQKELDENGSSGYRMVGQTVFSSTFGGKEAAAIIERPSDAKKFRYEYKLIATSKTSTLEREIQAAAADGFIAVNMTVGKTAMGGNELVVILRRQR